MESPQNTITFQYADEAMRLRIAAEWGAMQARHMRLDNGFSIVAMSDGEPVGLISISWRQLLAPLPATGEGFIDIIEVREPFRRRGVARRLVHMASARIAERGCYQIRAWSSEDKTEAIATWKALGFALCPATEKPGRTGEEIRGYFVARVL